MASKPSDTLNKFILMSKPSVGYKDIPLLWIKMVDISNSWFYFT
jgi:taurine transport system permease protein